MASRHTIVCGRLAVAHGRVAWVPCRTLPWKQAFSVTVTVRSKSTTNGLRACMPACMRTAGVLT
eukprot:354879-Chlamydomonas_euryale.AAC.6